MQELRRDFWNSEPSWPCQRLRLGFALVLFFFFEVFIGQKLPDVMPAIMLGLGIALLASAALSIREWKLQVQLALLREALEKAPKVEVTPSST